MFESRQTFEYGSNHGDPAGGGPLWGSDGTHGYDPARWALWKREFQTFANSPVREPGAIEAAQVVCGLAV
ncbi:hypothetical protein BV898_13869 [Hypsibius exemplaris]|uniref:Uncharacterized protein n=1 Tax=Hypsibius exemplaris TaxID=2072580 RepID=A0A1W0W9G4_HYPEX|nr:hypothetical protein BV898_13869 [Hypsibius exemplaris]